MVVHLIAAIVPGALDSGFGNNAVQASGARNVFDNCDNRANAGCKLCCSFYLSHIRARVFTAIDVNAICRLF